MPNTEETTARALAGQLIPFMETGIPPGRLFTEDVVCTSPTSLGELTLRWVMPPPAPRADDDRDRAHSLEAGAVGRSLASRKGGPMANSFFRGFELAAWM